MSEKTVLLGETEISADSSNNTAQYNLENLAEENSSQIFKEAEKAVVEGWKIGDVILDTYEVKEIFTGGAMGLVYHVYHRNWNTDLIIKVPRSKYFQSVTHKENFKREAETWVNLNLHPHIVSCYYVREIDEIPMVFAEFIEGGTLKDWIGNEGKGHLYEGGKKASLERILDIAIQSAWGLDYAHENGLIHQDVKPANIMMTAEGTAKITDFGLARASKSFEKKLANSISYNAEQSLIVEGGGMTPAYASPEQLANKSLSKKTDIWSWALSVLEMFTGDVTWISGGVATAALEDFLETEAEYPQLPEMPKSLAKLLQNCFNKDLSTRTENLLEISNEIQQIYHFEIGKAHQRQLFRANETLADTFNNRAVSFFDLGKKTHAIKLWEQALETQPQHQEATYNLGLTLWRDSKVDDETLINQLDEIRNEQSYEWKVVQPLVLIHLERGDIQTANELLIKVEDENKEVSNLKSLAKALSSQNFGSFGSSELHCRRIEQVPVGIDETYYNRAVFTKNGDNVFFGTEDLDRWNNLNSWDTSNQRDLHESEEIQNFAVTPDGKYALLLGNDLSLWDIQNNTRTTIIKENDIKSQINLINLNSNGKLALCVKQKNKIEGISLLDLNTGDEILNLNIDGILSQDIFFSHICFSQDNNSVFGITYHSSLKYSLLTFWDLETGRQSRYFEVTGTIETFCLSPDGRYIILSIRKSNEIMLFDTECGQCTKMFSGHDQTVTSICFSPEGSFILSGSQDKTVKLWDVETNRCLRTFEGHNRDIVTVYFREDGKSALSFDSNALIKEWSINKNVYRSPYLISQPVNNALTFTRLLEFEDQIEQAQKFLSSGNYAKAFESVKSARLIPGHTRMPESMKLWFHLYPYLQLSTLESSWEKRSFSFGAENWTIENGVKFESPPMPPQISSDGRFIWIVKENKLEIWEVETGVCINVLDKHKGNIVDICFNADNQLICTASSDKTIMLWNVETGRCLQTFRGHIDDITSVCFSSDGRMILSISFDKIIKLWDRNTGECIRTYQTSLSGINLLRIISNGDSILIYNSRKIQILDTITGERIIDLDFVTNRGDGGSILCFDFSSDGNYLVISDARQECLQLLYLATDIHASGLADRLSFFEPTKPPDEVKIDYWYEDAPEEIKEMLNSKMQARALRPHIVRFSPDCRYVASVTNYQPQTRGKITCVIEVWDTRTRKLFQVFDKYVHRVSSISWSPDGRFIITGSYEGKTALWDAKTGRHLKTLQHKRTNLSPFQMEEKHFSAVQFSNDMRYAFSLVKNKYTDDCEFSVNVWILDWKLEERQISNLENEIGPFIESFLFEHFNFQEIRRIEREAKVTHGNDDKEILKNLISMSLPKHFNLKDSDLNQLIHILKSVGYGWLTPENVKKHLQSIYQCNKDKLQQTRKLYNMLAERNFTQRKPSAESSSDDKSLKLLTLLEDARRSNIEERLEYKASKKDKVNKHVEPSLDSNTYLLIIGIAVILLLFFLVLFLF